MSVQIEPPRHEPTEKEIAEATAAIRKGWSEDTYRKRAPWAFCDEYETPEVHHQRMSEGRRRTALSPKHFE